MQVPEGWPFLWPSAYFVLHTLEELPDFADWVTRHFGPLTTLTFATTHIPMFLLVFTASWLALRRQRHGRWVVLAVAAGVEFALNAVFHLVTAAASGEYSPGMLTASSLGLPGSVLFVRWAYADQRVNRRELVAAVLLGTGIAAAAVGVLYLR